MKTKKIVGLTLTLLASITLLGACSSNSNQTTSSSSSNETASQNSTTTIGEYLKNDKDPIVLFEVKEIDKETYTKQVYVFQNSKVTSYDLSIQLSELAKLDNSEIIELLEERYYSKIQEKYETELKSLEKSSYAEDYKQELIARLTEFKPELDAVKIQSFPYEILLKTDASGNATEEEHFNFKEVEIGYDPRIDAEGSTYMGVETKEDGFNVQSYAGTYSIYNTSFAAFHIPNSSMVKFLITPVKNEITFEIDQPDTELENVTIN